MWHVEAQRHTGCRLCAWGLMSATMKCGLCTLFGAAPLVPVSRHPNSRQEFRKSIHVQSLCSLVSSDRDGLFDDGAAYREVLSLHMVSMSQPMSQEIAFYYFCSQDIACRLIRRPSTEMRQPQGSAKAVYWEEHTFGVAIGGMQSCLKCRFCIAYTSFVCQVEVLGKIKSYGEMRLSAAACAARCPIGEWLYRSSA